MAEKIFEINNLISLISEERLQGKRVGLSHGVFDLLHPGHIQHFIAAKRNVDILVVSITSDEFVNKGPGRPIFNESIRMSTLAALTAVDFVTISKDKTAVKLIDMLKPDVYFKGSDYANSTDDPTGKIIDEKKAVQKYGGEVHFTNELTASSSKLINTYLNPITNISRSWIEEIKKKISLVEIVSYLSELSKLRIAIIGEVILDKYTKVDALSKSSKDPILAFQLDETNTFAGGSLAIANNCSSWVNDVTVFSTVGLDNKQPSALISLLNNQIRLVLQPTKRSTIIKQRYVDKGTNSKVFETYNFDPSPLSPRESESLIKSLGPLERFDLVLIADYGHGLLTSEIINYLCGQRVYLAGNAQANAGNRGYNSLTKYSRLNFFSANSAELKLELRSQQIDYDVVVPQLMKTLGSQHAVLTSGGDGLTVYDKNSSHSAPALATRVVDKVGAGDSVFAIASLLAYSGAPLEVIGLISSIVASHEVSQVGHQSSLTLGDIHKQLITILR